MRLFNSTQLKDPAAREAFSIELSNRFHLLSDLPIDDLDKYCSKDQESFTSTSEEVLGYKVNVKKPWIGKDTWDLIEERRNLKHKLLAAKGVGELTPL